MIKASLHCDSSSVPYSDMDDSQSYLKKHFVKQKRKPHYQPNQPISLLDHELVSISPNGLKMLPGFAITLNETFSVLKKQMEDDGIKTFERSANSNVWKNCQNLTG